MSRYTIIFKSATGKSDSIEVAAQDYQQAYKRAESKVLKLGGHWYIHSVSPGYYSHIEK